MDLISRYAWVLLIGVTVVNYVIIKARVQEHIDINPDLKAGYDQILKALLIYGTIPGLIMAMGSLTGRTTSVYDYFHPGTLTLNPFVLLLHLYIIVIWILAVRWIYFKQGAEILVRHPGVFTYRGLGNSVTPTSTIIKIVFALALLGGIVGMTRMWIADFPAFLENLFS
ncbi:hypothetical protein [Spirosoma endbachense]|uniref:Uncharacterized protein n=1 Tax=Spirosoma endbachense TaxID=2666025 RepID=A0A6P1W6G3_9BACT|nr:hypothetical protein [Spirosoma endbachense]QHW01012.1 hypothetical protein GJR95_40940 [Spirosoma endbachense]